MTKDEALNLALEALEGIYYGTDTGPRVQYASITAIKEALAQPEQEPFTQWLVCPKCSYKSPYSPIKAKTLAEDAERITKQTRAVLAQPKREWVGLTDDEINTAWEKWIGTERANKSYTLAIEAKLKELNHE